MKKILLIISLGISFNSISQTKAVTESGEEVILYDNGTWKSLENKQGWETRLDTLKFTKPTSSTFQVKSSKIDIGIWINPKKWQFEKNNPSDGPAEYTFTLKNEDAYGMIITEQITMSLNSLKDLAFKNVVKIAPDARIIKEEIRNVNGIYVGLLQMEATVEGIEATYYNYYYSSDNGIFQFLTYTSKNLFNKYKPEMEQLLNGVVRLNK